MVVALGILGVLGGGALRPARADVPPEGRRQFDAAVAIEAPTGSLPLGTAVPVALPDDWARSRPQFEGEVRYRIAFAPPGPTASKDGPSALWIERACGLVGVTVNGQVLQRAARTPAESAGRCAPRLFTLPDALLDRSGHNVVEITLAGPPLRRLPAREFSASLSRVTVGDGARLEADRARQAFLADRGRSSPRPS